MIEAHELTKRYGDTTAVHSLSFTIAPGTVTGFLGPNGAGKSTTMRMIMGLDRPTSGTVTVNGKPYRQHRAPLREVGALLEASAVHPGRSARSHLRSMAATHNIKASRVSEVIEMTGLAGVATKRVGGFSLGMGQRLGIAAALLGDPRTLLLDEPVNGLDPEGVQWVRQLVRALAAEGRTVFLSSHLMSEMSQTADHLLVIGRGRIIAAGPVQQVIDPVAGQGCLASLVNGGGVAVVDVGFWRADVINGALLKEVPGTGFEVNQAFLVFITIYILIPSLMVIVSLLAPAKINRTTNIIASVIYAVSVVLSLIGETWIYYILGSAVEVILLLVIARTAWTWPRRSAAATGRSPLTAPEPWRTRVTHVRPQIEPSYLERDEQDEFN